MNGDVAEEDVNVHEFNSVARNIYDKMIGQSVFSIYFMRKDNTKTFGNISLVKVTPERTIDPGLLFPRFLIVSQLGVLSLKGILKYELSPFSQALFEARKVLRKPVNPQLANAITDYATKAVWEIRESIGDTPPKTQHVIDGDSRLQQLPWKRGDTYSSIAQSYAENHDSALSKGNGCFNGYL
mgnify:CR=1 FL=1